MKETPFSLSSEIVIDQFFIQDESQGAITGMYPPNFYDDSDPFIILGRVIGLTYMLTAQFCQIPSPLSSFFHGYIRYFFQFLTINWTLKIFEK